MRIHMSEDRVIFGSRGLENSRDFPFLCVFELVFKKKRIERRIQVEFAQNLVQITLGNASGWHPQQCQSRHASIIGKKSSPSGGSISNKMLGNLLGIKIQMVTSRISGGKISHPGSGTQWSTCGVVKKRSTSIVLLAICKGNSRNEPWYCSETRFYTKSDDVSSLSVVLNARGEIGCQPVLLFGTFFLQRKRPSLFLEKIPSRAKKMFPTISSGTFYQSGY